MYNLLFFIFLIGLLLYISNISNNNPSQKEIQSLEYVKEKQSEDVIKTKDQVYPQITNGFKRLNKELIKKPLDNLSKLLPNNNKTIDILRNNNNTLNAKRVYLPDYYRKDRLSGNTIGSEEYRDFKPNNEEPDNSWTDINISEHPKYYTSEFSNELTNSGSFYDKNNNFNDKTSTNSEVLTTDNCYMDKMGNQFCEDNTRLQLIPPSLISDPKSCKLLENIGSYKI